MTLSSLKQPTGASNTLPNSALIISLLGMSALVDVPEVGLFIAICVYAAPRYFQDKASGFSRSVKHFNRAPVGFASASHGAIAVVGTLLLVVVLCGEVHCAIVLGTAFAYLVLDKFGKAPKFKSVDVGNGLKVVKAKTFQPRAPTQTKSLSSTSATCSSRVSSPCKTTDSVSAVERSKLSSPCKVTSSSPATVQDRQQCWWLNGPSAKDAANQPPKSFEMEIQRIVTCSTPTPNDDRLMRKLQTMTESCILPLIPEAVVSCTSQVNFDIIGGMGDKPEINMVVSVDPTVLFNRLASVKKDQATLMPELLNKTATKVLADRLTFVRFWRSQFSGPEPVIVLLVPPSPSTRSYPLIINFSVNVVYPVRLGKLLSKMDAQTKELTLLVLRWARQRCVCNISRGQPTLYMWTLFVVYFSRLKDSGSDEVKVKTSKLLEEFFAFYMERIRSSEPLSVCFSSEVTAPEDDGISRAIANIEDPFDQRANLGENMTVDGKLRVQEELARAISILDESGDGRLSKLLERWFPVSAGKM